MKKIIYNTNTFYGILPKITINNNFNHFSVEDEKYLYLKYIYNFSDNQIENKKNALKYFYNNIYLSNIYYLIKYYGFQYKWINILQDDIRLPDYTENSFKKENNHFVKDCNKNICSLGMDILKNGLLTPFYLREYNINNIKFYMPTGGKHRIYSLRQMPKEMIKNKKFLALIFPPDYWDNKIGINKNKYPLMLHDICTGFFYNSHLECYDFNDIEHYFKTFRAFSESMGDYIYHFKDEIKPNPIFNNQILFENFINNEKFTPN